MISNPKEFLSNIKIVAFDFDQTLVDEAFPVRQRWQETLGKFLHLHEKLEEKFMAIFDAKGHKYTTNLDDTLQELNVSDEHITPIMESFRSTHSDKELVYKNVFDVITLLKKEGFRVGIITDGRKGYQEDRLKHSGLYNLFDFFYYGDDHQKPDLEFFRKCINGENILPNELLYIGDDMVKDVKGVLSAGGKACFMGDSGDVLVPEEAPSFKTMYDLYQWLKQK